MNKILNKIINSVKYEENMYNIIILCIIAFVLCYIIKNLFSTNNNNNTNSQDTETSEDILTSEDEVSTANEPLSLPDLDETTTDSNSFYDNVNIRNLSLQNYLYGKHPQTIREMKIGENVYEYDDIYYNSRDEHDIVGIIIGKQFRYTKDSEVVDIFNIRFKKDINISKNRDKNLPTNLGANCLSKTKSELNQILDKLNIKTKTNNKKKICQMIMARLLDLEKNSTGDNKKTYIKIPMNHPKYMFPYNTLDRIEYLKKQIRIIFSEVQNTTITITRNKLVLNSAKIGDDQHSKLEKMGGVYKKKLYYFNI